ncbi:MAG: sterol desaturase, partial [Ilumatobacteraceae bacterium]|nr:sterol desaturase [Ilumatobacteraceae bacterium]
THNPFRIAYHEYAAIARDVNSARGLRHKLGHVFGKPGWTPAKPAVGSFRTSGELPAEVSPA